MRVGEDEEGGGAAEALKERRSQCTAGECNARRAKQYGALRQRVHSTALYGRTVLSLLSLSLSFVHSSGLLLCAHTYTRRRCCSSAPIEFVDAIRVWSHAPRRQQIASPHRRARSLKTLTNIYCFAYSHTLYLHRIDIDELLACRC